MALQSSGTISFENIKDEFGLPTNRNIGYYRQTFSGNTKYGELTFNGISPGIPSSGPIAFSDFYGKKLNIVVNYFSSNEEKPQTARARYIAGSNAEGYVAGKVTVVGTLKNRPADTSGSRVIIHVNKRIGSNKANETSCAVRTGTGWEAGTELQIDVGNEAQIMGAGGNGGAGSEGAGNGFPGGKGTSGLGIQFGTSSNKVVVQIQSGALITGGYGGGGGGGGGAGFPAGQGGAAGEQGTEGGNGGDGSLFSGGAGGGGGNNGGEAVAGGGGSGAGPSPETGGTTAEAGGEGEGGENSGGSGGNFGDNGEGILVTGASNTVTINETNEVQLGISYSTTVT